MTTPVDELVDNLGTLVSRQKYITSKSKQTTDLSLSQQKTLSLIIENPGISNGELSTALKIRTASVSDVSKKLSAKGYIVITHDARDKRVSRLAASPKGLAAQYDLSHTGYNDVIKQCLTDDECITLNSLISKLVAGIETNAGYIEKDR